MKYAMTVTVQYQYNETGPCQSDLLFTGIAVRLDFIKYTTPLSTYHYKSVCAIYFSKRRHWRFVDFEGVEQRQKQHQIA